jgi:hypothetical protein
MLNIADWMGGMPFTELGGFIIPLLCAILGGGGIWALLGARTAARATERVAEATAMATERAAEAAARATERAAALAAEAPTAVAATADWSALMSYWQTEMTAVREAATRMEARLTAIEQLRQEDLEHIEDLEQHIWARKPPPPPARRSKAPGTISGAFVITTDPPEGTP